MLLRRVLRRRLVRVSIETEVLRRVLRRGGCYRRRLGGAWKAETRPFAEYDPLRVHPIVGRLLLHLPSECSEHIDSQANRTPHTHTHTCTIG